jgi:hypothetical protein
VVSVLAALSVGLVSRNAHATSCGAQAFGDATGTCGVGVGGQSAFVGTNGGYLRQAYAVAQPGGLAIVANAQAISNVWYFHPQSQADASANFRVDDIIFRATSGTPASFINVSLNVAVSGVLSAWLGGNSTFPQGGGAASGELYVTVSLNGYPSSGYQTFGCTSEGCRGSSGGMFASGTIGQFSTSTVQVPTNRPVTLTVSASVGTQVRDCIALCGTIGAYGQTISLPTSGPVFSLPDGYTVDSASLSLQDNLWLGSPPQIQEELAYLVPEPAMTGLAAASGIALARLRRRRARNGAGAARAPETA